jgi:hypothetical protein
MSYIHDIPWYPMSYIHVIYPWYPERDIPDVIDLGGTKAQHLSMAVRVLGASVSEAGEFRSMAFWNLRISNGNWDLMGLNQQKRWFHGT